MDEIKYRRRAGDASERLGISRRWSFQVGRFHRHGVDLLGTSRRVLEQALAQMGEVSVRMPRRRHTLVYLRHMHPVPRDIFARQVTQHKPWGMAAAHGQDEAAARGDGCSGLCSDNRGALSGDRFGSLQEL